MDHLWSPWRYSYVTKDTPVTGCVFCTKMGEDNDRENLILYRGPRCFVVLNRYPYTTGHLMIVPYEHVSTLEDASPESTSEMMDLTRLASKHLRAVYRPGGLNIGMNIGECAGAGIAGHIHMHVLPRWTGDVSFVTAVGETRVLPEDLDATYEKLVRAWNLC
ncbi:MAG TPA: HIT domain-containing protein [Bryobacteraceae bacterium]|nr:HIT domain-containing protein [Bryobacteraceae bacterium]